MSKARTVEVGRITTQNADGGTHIVQFGLLLELDTPEQLLAAIATGKLEFSVFDEDPGDMAAPQQSTPIGLR